eukprot:TRINITY_DN5151_c0_g2_i2.p1 TRINITY_DN5151_c0_g2~~TRINITY_DN5151_c0_g2_i2.p1  ORF type:complete len:331 (-),score=63.06 TRINITY_DN5151_c0_g2_i2:51-1043(-)
MSTSISWDIDDLTLLFKHLTQLVLPKFPYPVAVIHEDFTKELMEKLVKPFVTPIHFVKIIFRIPSFYKPVLDYEPIFVRHHNEEGKEPHVHVHGLVYFAKRNTLGYYHMCRFYSGFGLLLPFFDQFDYFWRFDSNQRHLEGKPVVDFIDRLVREKKKYFYHVSFIEQVLDVLEGFAVFVKEYVTTNNLTTFLYTRGKVRILDAALNKPLRPDCSKVKPLPPETTPHRFADGKNPYNWNCVDNDLGYFPAFYNNFEVMDFSVLRSEIYTKFLDATDKRGGFYFHRWGDAMVRMAGVSLAVKAEDIEYIDDPGWTHHIGKKRLWDWEEFDPS